MSTQTIESFIRTAKLLSPGISLLLRGETGIGKSYLIRQLARHFNIKLIDRRLGQMTEGDMIGLPSIADDCTRFNPPDWYKEACDKPCFVFLDEMNRGTVETMQAAFQVVLDRELNGWKLHPQSRVAAAVNVGARYTVNDMDPALLRRFFVADLQPTSDDWLAWARDSEGGNMHPLVISFISSQTKFLDPSDKADPGSVQPTRATWERLNNELVQTGLINTPNDPTFYSMTMGFLGTEATIAFHDFAKNFEHQVSGADVVNHYLDPKRNVRKTIQSMGQERWNMVIDRVCDYVNDHVTKFSPKQAENIGALVGDLPAELRIVIWGRLVAKGVERVELAKSMHSQIVGPILKVFGVEPGEKGVGMIPVIPQILQKQPNR